MSDAAEFDIDTLRTERIRRQREYYTSEEGFLDFVRDSGAAPDAEFQPHGRYAQDLITWRGDPDPDNPKVTNYKPKLVLWPRGSFKSQVFNVGQAAWLIARDPNIRILVTSETGRQARKFVQETMKIIESEWFKELFGDHTQAEWKPGSGSFTSSLRTRKGVKDPTLQAAGVGEVQTGAHWDFIFYDDVCSQENTKTPESIESLWAWYGETKAQLDPGGKTFIIGTLHHFADIYCKIIKDPELAAEFEISKHAWSDPIVDPSLPAKLAPAQLFFPNRLTRTFVARQKKELVPRLYACFYENRPTTGEQQLFRPEYFRCIPDDNVPSAIWTYLLSDFAFLSEEKKKGKADRTVFWLVGLDCNRVAYVLDVVIGRWKPSDSVRVACDLWNRYQWANLRGMTVEKTTYSELLLSVFEEVRMQTFIQPRIIPIGGRSQEIKEMRIEAAEPRFRGGNVYFVQSLRDNWRKWKPMFDEMTEFPFSAHDDVPDAFSDLDKKDETGGRPVFYCPHPPPGFATPAVRRFQPATINGRFNPDYGYPAREMTKADQGGHDLWSTSSSTTRRNQPEEPRPSDAGASIFQRPPPPPTRWE